MSIDDVWGTTRGTGRGGVGSGMNRGVELMARVNYYARECLTHHAHEVLEDELNARGGDSVATLWLAWCLDQEGQPGPAIKLYNSLKERGRGDFPREVRAACVVGALRAHKRCKLIDAEQVAVLEGLLHTIDESTPESRMHAANMYWHLGQHALAREQLDGIPEDTRDEYMDARCVKGWVYLTSGRADGIRESLAMFEGAMEEDRERPGRFDVDAMMGRVTWYERMGQLEESINLLRQIKVRVRDFVPAHIKEAKLLIKQGAWDQAREIASELMDPSRPSFEPRLISILHQLVRQCRVSVAVNELSDLMKDMETLEPHNPWLCNHVARTVSRLGCGNTNILEMMKQLAEKAARHSPNNADYLCTLGDTFVLMGDWNIAYDNFLAASQADQGSIRAMTGLIRCQLMLGQLDDAERQMEFLTEIQASVGKSVELTYLAAVLLWRQRGARDAAVAKLDEAYELLHSWSERQVPTFEFYAEFDPALLLNIVREYLQHVPDEPLEPTDPPCPIVKKAILPLELFVRWVPGSIDGQLLMARARFVLGESGRAVEQCLRLDENSAEAHILSAQLAHHADNPDAAMRALGQAVSHSFHAEGWPLYHLTRARVLASKGDLEDALESIVKARALVDAAGVRGDPRSYLSVYIEHALLLARLRRPVDAKKTAEECLVILPLLFVYGEFVSCQKQFRNAEEEGKVIVAQGLVAVKENVNEALRFLGSVRAESPYFLKARAQSAHIQLMLRNDKRAFIRCYKDVVDRAKEGVQRATERLPEGAGEDTREHKELVAEQEELVRGLVFLGEAFMAVQEPEQAVRVYREARKLNKEDSDLSSRVGRALIATHDYAKAVGYYEKAVLKNPSRVTFHHDLANLFWRLGRAQDAERTLKAAMKALARKEGEYEEMAKLQDRVHTMLLRARVHRSDGNLRLAVKVSPVFVRSYCSVVGKHLVKARTHQNDVLGRVRGESPEAQYRQRRVAADISFELGELHASLNEHDSAVSAYREALKFDEAHERSMLALATMYLRRGEVGECETQCNALLRVDQHNDEATLMLAGLYFQRGNYSDAEHHYKSLLDRRPTHYEALAEFVQLLRRSGKLQEIPRYLEASERALGRARLDPGLHYARGLHHRYSNRPRDAIKELNIGRHPKDGAWSQRCLEGMIEVYLNPDNENMWKEADGGEGGSNLREAEKLLGEVVDETRRELLRGWALISTRQQSNLERAHTKFYEIRTSLLGGGGGDAAEGDATTESPTADVPCLVGMATAAHLLKQKGKGGTSATNYLKRVAKVKYNHAEADDFERGYLLLADIYIQSGKFDMAMDLLRKAIHHNQSCGRAWEYLGLIYEKEESYRDAADCYENSWRLINESDPVIGFKLAFNYLKAQRFVSAIDVCHKVLSRHPHYPKIRRECLDKARQGLRP